MGKKESIFDKRKIISYEKRVSEIKEYYSEYKKQFEAYKSKLVSSSLKKYEKLTTEDMYHITPEFVAAGGDLDNNVIKDLKKYYAFCKYIDEKYPELSSLDLESKINKLIEKINNGEKLSNGTVANIFYLAVLSSKKYKALYAKYIKPNLNKSLKFPESFIAALKKSKLIVKPNNMVEMLNSIGSYKSDLINNIEKEMEKCNAEDSEIYLMYLSRNLKRLYGKSLYEVISSETKNEYYRKTKNFDKYMDYRFPELSFLKYDKKLERLIEKANSEDSNSFFNSDVLVDLLYLSSQVSTKYNDIYLKISSSLSLKDSDSKTIIDKLKELDIELDPKGMLEKLSTFDKFYTSEQKSYETTSAYIKELEQLGLVDKEKLDHEKDLILEELLPNAYALVSLACNVKLGISPYDVQLMGAEVLNAGNIAQMYTGEGKSLTALFPAYLNSLTGEEIDIYTPNDYLAIRDSKNARFVLESLGITVGCVLSDNQSRNAKKLAYKSNVVYGSTSAFAFDTISDSYEKTKDGMVQRLDKPRMAIIDEADQFFVDEALVPYKLDSGQGNKEENDEVKQYLLEAFDTASRLCEKAFSETDNPTDDQVGKYTGEELTKRFGLRYGTEEEIEEINRVQENYYVVLGENDIAITDLGNVALLKWSNQDKIDELAQKARSYFLISSYFVENEDYIYGDKQITLTDSGLLKATKKIKEFADLEKEWLGEEKTQIMMGYIKTQLKAFSMKKGANDNGYDVRENPDTGKKEIVILQAGRIKEMSKYERGLHQALQLKEGLEIDTDDRLLDSSFDSITIVSLLNKYYKICGMTGTADKDAFRDIYHLDTVDIPKNAEYQYKKNPSAKKPSEIVENPTILYKQNSYKIGAIVSDILDSRLSGQPVLLITDSNEEAKHIYNRLQKQGISTKLNLLISDKSLEEEAEIVSHAGEIGSITIASEMAGRGTDIKLYSERDKEDSLLIAKEELFRKIVIEDLFIKKYGIDENQTYKKPSALRKFANSITNTSAYEKALNDLNEKYESDTEFKKDIDMQIDALSKIMIETHEAKGLKLIQSRPFKTSRHDRQARGRVGRQGEPGEVSLYASLSDLSSIGISDEVINSIDEGFFSNGKVSVISDIVDEEIERAQGNIEMIEDTVIASQVGVGYAINSISTKFLNTRSELVNTEDLTFSLYSMIDDSINEVLKENVSADKKKKISTNKKISLRKLNVDGAIDMFDEMFGIRVSEESLSECKTVNDFKQFIVDKLDKKIDAAKEVIGTKGYNEFVREKMLQGLNSTYDTFMYYVDEIKYQELNDRLAQNSSNNRLKDINILYDEVVADGWKNIMGSIFNPTHTIEKENEASVSDLEVIDDSDMVSIESFDEIGTIKK